MEETDKEAAERTKGANQLEPYLKPQKLTIPQRIGHVWIYEGMAGYMTLGGVMWTLGYTDWTYEEGPKDVYWGDCATFACAVRELYENVEKLLNDAEEYEISYYEQVLADILDIMNDPGIMDDPDQWEDMEFTDDFGEIVYFVTES